MKRNVVFLAVIGSLAVMEVAFVALGGRFRMPDEITGQDIQTHQNPDDVFLTTLRARYAETLDLAAAEAAVGRDPEVRKLAEGLLKQRRQDMDRLQSMKMARN